MVERSRLTKYPICDTTGSGVFFGLFSLLASSAPDVGRHYVLSWGAHFLPRSSVLESAHFNWISIERVYQKYIELSMSNKKRTQDYSMGCDLQFGTNPVQPYDSTALFLRFSSEERQLVDITPYATLVPGTKFPRFYPGRRRRGLDRTPAPYPAGFPSSPSNSSRSGANSMSFCSGSRFS